MLDIVVWSQTQTKPVDDGVQLIQVRHGHGRFKRINDASIAARGNYHQAAPPNDLTNCMLIQVLVYNQLASLLFLGKMVFEFFHQCAATDSFTCRPLDTYRRGRSRLKLTSGVSTIRTIPYIPIPRQL